MAMLWRMGRWAISSQYNGAFCIALDEKTACGEKYLIEKCYRKKQGGHMMRGPPFCLFCYTGNGRLKAPRYRR